MNTNMNAMTLEEMEAISGGDTMDHVGGAITGATAGAMAGGMVGCIAGAPGCVIGVVVGGVGGGVAGGIAGLRKMRSWVRSLFNKD